MKAQVGDIVHVSGTVTKVPPTTVEGGFYTIRVIGAVLYASERDFVHVEPKPIRVGDKGVVRDLDGVSEVIGVDGSDIWCKRVGSDGATRRFTCNYLLFERTVDV